MPMIPRCLHRLRTLTGVLALAVAACLGGVAHAEEPAVLADAPPMSPEMRRVRGRRRSSFSA